jgi:ABC-type lipoprotein release transport system permease subunit
VAVFIFTVSMMDGLVVFFTQRLIRVSPLLTVLPERLDVNLAREELRRAHPGELMEFTRPPVPDDRPTVRGAIALAQRIRAVHGIEGASVAGAAPAVLSFGTIAEPATLVGLDPYAEGTVTELPRCVVKGSWEGLAKRRDGAVVGAQLADRLGVQVGDRMVAVGASSRMASFPARRASRNRSTTNVVLPEPAGPVTRSIGSSVARLGRACPDPTGPSKPPANLPGTSRSRCT